MKLKAFIESMLAKGRLSFDRDEVVTALGVAPDAVLAAARRAQSAGILLHPRRGFFVIVPPQARVFGAPPVNQIIDPLMKFEGARYYVGLLKAAELHGAAHQAVMEFQVVCDKRLPEIEIGRSVIRSFFRKEWPDAGLIEIRTTDTGTYLVSGATLTAFDLCRYPAAAGTLDAAATVIAELAEQMNEKQIDTALANVERPVAQRLGYILDHVGQPHLAERILHAMKSDFRLSDFDPPGSDPEQVQIDRRWKLKIHKPLETDYDSEGPHP
ncbi:MULTISPECIES: type IV toxin-antitoxin system AbiEi family antitoxin domain-containing protein [unclassified Bradyrhizobium]|uniref:type IV toxin-antitoxin system AbiEi family antitoxin domain-containing protein n=1 Tax=Bradyrhizobium sp. USDA 4541 TaxID=2817704 RepID=UPI0020A3D448|nr:type IV toxin-antitoxin system AbiEi family antitoxin [Bradyrhizobium sp. USDA 4541]MCP1854415.1 putative transcriptional regulator of viral defense system [Bradyrhizobium sp. USDA 4541]